MTRVALKTAAIFAARSTASMEDLDPSVPTTMVE